MATIVAIHGTFAQNGSGAGGPDAEPGDPQWWQAGSIFEKEMQQLVDGKGGPVEVSRFQWSGENSETSRREAGRQLFDHLVQLEARNEPYCVVAHSHGGSVLSAALLESAARKKPLDRLKRWVTIGTPFVQLRREWWLFSRLNLVGKVIFVASMMLLMMFLVYFAAGLWTGETSLIGGSVPEVLALTAGMMSLPAVVCYLVLKYFDSRALVHYRRSVKRRARDWFANRWLSLTHPDDEAVQGLTLLPATRLSFFDRAFAIPAITTISVAALPLLYLYLVASPTLMVGLADWLRHRIYDAQSSPEAEKAVKDLRERLRSMIPPEGWAPRTGSSSKPTATVRPEGWENFRVARREAEAKFPDFRRAERALRFRARFFEQNGVPCPGDKLCGGGHHLRINSGLLLHVVTDEVSWALGVESSSSWQLRWLWSMVITAVLVPIIFIGIALAIMMAIRAVASLVSQGTSNALNSLTSAEVKRAAFGNDTEGEIALGAIDRPVWIDESPARLPAGAADLVTSFANGVASQSLAKLRKAIGQLASAEAKQAPETALTSYFTWKELVHGSYFDVPHFRKLLAQAVSRAEGFAPSAQFRADPHYALTAQWLAEMEGTPAAPASPSARSPTPADKEAVGAVVVSTVKVEP